MGVNFDCVFVSWGGSAYEGGGDARRKFWIKPLNFDYMNRVNKTNWKYIIFNISSSATLKEAFTAKNNGVLPRTP